MNSGTRLLLLRHAEVEEKYHRVFGGRIDMNLSARGHTQAAALARHVRQKPVDVVYLSPMKRAQQTFAPLTGHSRREPVVRSELREVDFGDWTGLNWDEVKTRFDVSAFEWLNQLELAGIPNAECGHTFRDRIEPCVRQIIAEHPAERVAILCHGGVIRMILSILLGLPLGKMSHFEIDYASVTELELHPHKTEVQLLNFTPWRDLA